MKIQASKLLLDNTANTFVTPVFNGSASLRDAAGQMIENTVKSTRRKEEINEAYMEKLFAEMTALYRLDQIEVSNGSKQSMGPLPGTAVLLLCMLAVTWVCIGVYSITESIKKKKAKETH